MALAVNASDTAATGHLRGGDGHLRWRRGRVGGGAVGGVATDAAAGTGRGDGGAWGGWRPVDGRAGGRARG